MKLLFIHKFYKKPETLSISYQNINQYITFVLHLVTLCPYI